jgi:hypothetical protein
MNPRIESRRGFAPGFRRTVMSILLQIGLLNLFSSCQKMKRSSYRAPNFSPSASHDVALLDNVIMEIFRGYSIVLATKRSEL